MMLFDTHAHYNLEPIWNDWENAVINAKSAGIMRAMVVGTERKSNERALWLKKMQPDFFLASLGIHPLFFLEEENKKMDEQNLINQELEIWRELIHKEDFQAYGEIGLDFFRVQENHEKIKTLQLKLLYEQIKEIKKNQRPIIWHVRDQKCDAKTTDNAYGQIIKIIQEEKITDLPMIFHCFSGNEAYLENVLKFPQAYISFAGNLTFKNSQELRSLIDKVPPAKLLIETDAPFLAPEPLRGQSCQPAFLRNTAEYLRQNLSLNLEQIWENSSKIFG